MAHRRYKGINQGLPGNCTFTTKDISDKEIAKWDAAEGKWENGTVASATIDLTDNYNWTGVHTFTPPLAGSNIDQTDNYNWTGMHEWTQQTMNHSSQLNDSPGFNLLLTDSDSGTINQDHWAINTTDDVFNIEALNDSWIFVRDALVIHWNGDVEVPSGTLQLQGGDLELTSGNGIIIDAGSITHTSGSHVMNNGTMVLDANRFTATYSLDMRNSDIRAGNAIFFNDESQSTGEGLCFPVAGTGPYDSYVNTDWYTFRIYQGDILYNDASGVDRLVVHEDMVPNFTGNILLENGSSYRGKDTGGTSQFLCGMSGGNNANFGNIARPTGIYSGATLTLFGTGETHARFTDNGAAELYYNNVKQVETTSDSILPSNNIRMNNNKTIFTKEVGGTWRSALIFNALDDMYFGDTNNDTHVRGQKVFMRHGVAAVLNTESTGVNVTGDIQVDTITKNFKNYTCIAGGYFAGAAATVVLEEDWGLDSITDNGTGDYTINCTETWNNSKEVTVIVVANGAQPLSHTIIPGATDTISMKFFEASTGNALNANAHFVVLRKEDV